VKGPRQELNTSVVDVEVRFRSTGMGSSMRSASNETSNVVPRTNVDRNAKS
jgi:hypothetical protein